MTEKLPGDPGLPPSVTQDDIDEYFSQPQCRKCGNLIVAESDDDKYCIDCWNKKQRR